MVYIAKQSLFLQIVGPFAFIEQNEDDNNDIVIDNNIVLLTIVIVIVFFLLDKGHGADNLQKDCFYITIECCCWALYK